MTEAQLKAQVLLEMQPVGQLTPVQVLPWVVKVLQFLLVEKVRGK